MKTLIYAEKQPSVARFFAIDTPDCERLALLEQWQVAYVFYGPDERSLGDWDPATVSWLEPVFGQGDVAVYRVKR